MVPLFPAGLSAQLASSRRRMAAICTLMASIDTRATCFGGGGGINGTLNADTPTPHLGAGRITTKPPRHKGKIHREDGEVREERFHHKGTKGTKGRPRAKDNFEF
jgi:hypothetical protein